MCIRDSIDAARVINDRNQLEYRIPLERLGLDAQHRWYMQQGEKAETTAVLELSLIHISPVGVFEVVLIFK